MRLYFLLLLLTTKILIAQNVVEKVLINSNISHIQIDATNCFEVELVTTNTKEVIIEATIDGEYKNDLILKANVSGETLLVSSGFRMGFKNPNDKLSIHKVVSIALKIQLPKQRNINVFGTNCITKVTGDYKYLKITMSDGNCYLTNIRGQLDIKTQSGHIYVKSKAATVASDSKYGMVVGELLPSNTNYFKLNTITGNIELMKIE